MDPAGKVPASMVSLPLPALIVSTSVAPSAPVMATCAARPMTVTELPAADDLDLVVAAGAGDRHVSAEPSPVPLPGVALRSRSTCVTPVPVRSPTVMVSAPPRAVKLMCLDAVEIHRDVGDVAREPRAGAVGRDVDLLVDVGAVELQRVGAVLALDGVAAVARIPDEGVVAGAAEQGVVAAAAGDDVVAVAAEQRVGAVAAGDGVVAGAAVDGELDEAGEAVAGGEGVVAAVHVEHEVLGGADVEGERSGVDAIEAHARAVGRERELLRRRCRR